MDAFTILVSVMICTVFASTNGAFVGDKCRMGGSGAEGVCVLITNCQYAVDNIVKHNIFPTQCGFQGRDQIVCCPKPPETTKPTTTPAPTRISQLSELSDSVKITANALPIIQCVNSVFFVFVADTECKEYEEAKYETYYPWNEPNKPTRLDKCTISGLDYIVGGVVANEAEFPHMV